MGKSPPRQGKPSGVKKYFWQSKTTCYLFSMQCKYKQIMMEHTVVIPFLRWNIYIWPPPPPKKKPIILLWSKTCPSCQQVQTKHITIGSIITLNLKKLGRGYDYVLLTHLLNKASIECVLSIFPSAWISIYCFLSI